MSTWLALNPPSCISTVSIALLKYLRISLYPYQVYMLLPVFRGLRVILRRAVVGFRDLMSAGNVLLVTVSVTNPSSGNVALVPCDAVAFRCPESIGSIAKPNCRAIPLDGQGDFLTPLRQHTGQTKKGRCQRPLSHGVSPAR